MLVRFKTTEGGHSMLNVAMTAIDFRKRAIFVVLFATGVLLGLVFLWVARIILLLLFAGAIGALLLTTLTNAVSSMLRLKRGLAFALVLVSCVLGLGLVLWIRGPQLTRELLDLQKDLPLAARKLVLRAQDYSWGRWLQEQYASGIPASGGISYALTRIGGVVSGTASTFAGLLLVVVASIYFAAEPQFYLRGLQRLTPRNVRPRLDLCLEHATQMLRSWLLAKFLSMFAIGLFIASGLWALDVPLAGTLGIIAALLTFIPNIGAILSFLPAALLAFSISPLKGLLTVLLFCAAHLLEGNLVTPLAERTIVKLPPALTLAAQLLMFSVAGALGVALAAPLVAVSIGILQVLLPSEERPSDSELAIVEQGII
jgi:predicted PurR-regulated permease PerM